MNRNLLIILRTCASVHMLNGQQRYVNCSKHELINVCLSSLVGSINKVSGHTIKLIVLDDHSSETAIVDFKNIIRHCKFPTEFISVVDGTGAKHTCKQVYDLVEKHATDLWYHVEDDYLHIPTAMQDMLDTYNKLEEDTGYSIAINPHDDVWRYTRQIYESLTLLGATHHYRSVKHSTYTCLTSKSVYDEYRNHFQDAAEWILRRDENETINQVWNKPDVMLFCPIPTVALHVSALDTQDPYIDFTALWDSIPKLWKATTPTFAVATMFNDSHAELAALTWEANKKQYCDKHGYIPAPKTTNFSTTQIHFDKFSHILHVMNTNPSVDWVWWIDNDAMITNLDVKLETLVNDTHHIIMSVDIASLNTGSFLVKNTAKAKQWLEFLLSKKTEYKNDTKWFDQQAVIDFYVKFQDLFHIVKQTTMNSYDYKMYNVSGIDLLGHNGQWNPGDFVIHWPGLSNANRVVLATRQLQQTK